MYCNVAEIVLYTSYTAGTTSTPTSPQTGFAVVGLAVVAVISGAALTVSKRRF
ncbi:MAG: hypothetical protein LUD44_00880 [Firmicutes bacterium]|nr:hypothetical protein [Bacillota bacterium]